MSVRVATIDWSIRRQQALIWTALSASVALVIYLTGLNGLW